MTDPRAPLPAGDALVPPGAQPEAVQERARSLVDGEWHRLHPATPLLRGGLAVIVAGAILVNSLRDRVVALFVPEAGDYDGGAPDAVGAVEELARSGTLIWVLLGLLGVLALFVLAFFLAWRVHRFRVTGDVVEVRQGILFRSHRRAPLARIQGVNIEKPWFARLFGACKLSIQSAGADANVELAYLATPLADALRFEILARAAGRTTSGAEQGASGSHAQRVVDDFLRPDAELDGVAPTSLVRLKPGTVLLSSLLDLGLILGVVFSIAAVVVVFVLDVPWLLFTLIPALISIVSITVRTLSQKLRYSIAQTRDGIRLAYGLLSTTTEVLPAGRIFSITVSQPLLWRPMGWWKVAFTRASKTTDASSGQQRQYANMLLPVGSRADVDLVIGLVLPGLRGTALLHDGLVGRGGSAADGATDADGIVDGAVTRSGVAEAGAVPMAGAPMAAAPSGTAPDAPASASLERSPEHGLPEHGLPERGLPEHGLPEHGLPERGLPEPSAVDAYVTTPRSARLLRPLAWRRNGVAIADDAVLLRKGRIWRSLGVVPLARTQSFAMHQGPIEGALGVAHLVVHVVGAALSPTIGALAVDDVQRVYDRARTLVPAAIGADTTETWHVRTAEGSGPSGPDVDRSTAEWSRSGPFGGAVPQDATDRPAGASPALPPPTGTPDWSRPAPTGHDSRPSGPDVDRSTAEWSRSGPFDDAAPQNATDRPAGASPALPPPTGTPDWSRPAPTGHDPRPSGPDVDRSTAEWSRSGPIDDEGTQNVTDRTVHPDADQPRTDQPRTDQPRTDEPRS
ncbi:hypothetical protein GCM10009846_24680 [Agrococcus versicolor]|uniref:YdbS-like PH domain-containing protein n=1 Tax=Agrococcus versicolor TaxID=501482 RepID=A0ABN3AVG7_9MICO